MPVHRFGQGGDAGDLHHRGGADEGVLLELGHLLDDGARADDVAHAPAGHAVGLAEAAHQEQVAAERGRAGAVERVVAAAPGGLGVAELVVDLVAQQQQVAALGQLGELPTGVLIRHDAGGVAGRVEQHHARPRGDGGLDALGGEGEIGVGVNEHRFRARDREQVLVHHEVGVGDDDLVAGVEAGEEGEDQAARHAAGHQQAAVLTRRPAIARQPPVGQLDLEATGDGLVQLVQSLGDGVLVDALLDGVDGRLFDARRHVEVRLADGEVDRILEPAGQLEHATDARGLHRGDALGDMTLGVEHGLAHPGLKAAAWRKA